MQAKQKNQNSAGVHFTAAPNINHPWARDYHPNNEKCHHAPHNTPNSSAGGPDPLPFASCGRFGVGWPGATGYARADPSRKSEYHRGKGKSRYFGRTGSLGENEITRCRYQHDNNGDAEYRSTRFRYDAETPKLNQMKRR